MHVIGEDVSEQLDVIPRFCRSSASAGHGMAADPVRALSCRRRRHHA